MSSAPSAPSPSTAAAWFTGRAVTRERRLSGTLTEVVLDDGRTVMVKRAEGVGAAREAFVEGLRLATAAGAAVLLVTAVAAWFLLRGQKLGGGAAPR